MNKLNSRIIISIILLLPVVVITILYFSLRKPDINFLSNHNYVVNTFSDKEDKGLSECNVQTINKKVQVVYSLRKGYEFPYAGIEIQQEGAKLFDAEDYILKMDIEAEQDFRVTLRMNLFLDNYSDTTKPMSLLFLVKPLVLQKGENHISINTRDISEIPDWWFEENPSRINTIKPYSLSKAREFTIVSDYSTPINTLVSFDVNSFRLTYNFYPLLKWGLLFSFLYYVVVFIFIKYKRAKNKYIYLPIEATTVVDSSLEIKDKIEEFIQEHYSHADLKLSDLLQHVNLSDDKVSAVLKQYFDKNFRQYLNHIRMEEAKRLLNDTDLQIAEIAYKVGYNNVTHFNRVFKEVTNDSPKNFRQ